MAGLCEAYPYCCLWGSLNSLCRYTKEPIQSAFRATLLVLNAFTLRLQDEDFTFIRKFIQRHLDFEATYKEPDLLQEASPSLTAPVYLTLSPFHLHSYTEMDGVILLPLLRMD